MSEKQDQLFWISWYQTTEDYRPLKDQRPEDRIIDYWCSGYRGRDDAATIVALTIATTEDDAKSLIKEHWPEAEEWRFCEVITKKGFTNNGRFTLSENGKPKLDKYKGT